MSPSLFRRATLPRAARCREARFLLEVLRALEESN
jgi:hypothetical protein